MPARVYYCIQIVFFFLQIFDRISRHICSNQAAIEFLHQGFK